MLIDYYGCKKTRVDRNLQNNQKHFKSNENMCKNFEQHLKQLNQCIPSKVKKEQIECQKGLAVSSEILVNYLFWIIVVGFSQKTTK